MARIIAGIGASHTPTIGYAKDNASPDDPAWAAVFQVFDPVRRWLIDNKPDVIFHIYNDHVTSFFMDHYSPFVMGVDTEYVTADEGGGRREYPPVKGHAELASHIGHSLFADEFDISFFQKRPVDHGLFSPLSMMTDRGKAWNEAVIPFQVGVLQYPVPTANRCYRLGQALRRAVESYSEDLNVVIAATGGLSHQVHGERAGYNDLDWDNRFLDLLENDPRALTEITHAEYARRGGFEGAEVIMWLIMRGALSANVKRVHRDLTLPSMTTIATVIYENLSETEPRAIEEHRAKVAHQLDGIGELDGTYPFTLDWSHKAFRLNGFLHRLTEPEHRRRFMEDRDALCEEFGLTRQERDLLEAKDFIGLIHYGVIFFVIEKLAVVLGMSNPDVYAQFRGEAIEEFMNSRNVAVHYSNAGAGE